MSEPTKVEPPPIKKEPVYRGMMEKQDGDYRSHLGDKLIEIDPKHMDSRTIYPSIAPMATLSMVAAWVGNDPKTSTLEGLMKYWETEFKNKAPSLDGEARKQYVEVAQTIALGAPEAAASLSGSLLNEGAKNLGTTSNKKEKGKK